MLPSNELLPSNIGPFNGKIVIVTGASEGIGACLVTALQKSGARVCLTARNEARLIVAARSGDLVVPGDITADSVRAAVVAKSIEHFGQIDILINNAGRGSYYSASATPVDEARAVFELNFFAPLALSQLALPHVRKTGGTVVNVSSIAGQISLPWLPVYSASKFALAAITSAQRTEFKKRGVHVMGVFPGYVNTDFQAHAIGPRPPERVEKARKFAVSAEECAAAILDGIAHRRRTVVTPRTGWLLVWANRLVPSFIESQLERAAHG
jgi:short-subunit dehydrogenase